MKAHGKFLIKGTLGKPVEMCGSDSFLSLDGRHCLRNHFKTMIEASKKNPRIIGFNIYKGELSYKDTEIIGHKVFNSMNKD